MKPELRKTSVSPLLSPDPAPEDIDLPSWVPDWRIQYGGTSNAEGEGCHRRPKAAFSQLADDDIQWYSGAPVQDMRNVNDGLQAQGLALGLFDAGDQHRPHRLFTFPECTFEAPQLAPMPGVLADQFRDSMHWKPLVQAPPPTDPSNITPRFGRFKDAVDDYHYSEHDRTKDQHLYGRFVRIHSAKVSTSGYSDTFTAPVKSGDWLCLLDRGYAFFILRPVPRLACPRENDTVVAGDDTTRKFLFITRMPPGWILWVRPPTTGVPQVLVDYECVSGTFELV